MLKQQSYNPFFLFKEDTKQFYKPHKRCINEVFNFTPRGLNISRLLGMRVYLQENEEL